MRTTQAECTRRTRALVLHHWKRDLIRYMAARMQGVPVGWLRALFATELFKDRSQKKHHDCAGCDFYTLVEKEEGKSHMLSTQLLKKLKFR